MELFIRAENDKSAADGSSQNRIIVNCVDERGNKVVGVDVIFRIESDIGLIFESQSPVYPTNTDGNGAAHCGVVSNQPGEVRISVQLADNKEVKEYLVVTFLEATTVFRISNATNTNRTFFPGHPSIAWVGATFKINTQGGSGNIEWTVLNSPAEVSVEKNGIVTIFATTPQGAVVKATDLVTGESDTYNFFVTTLLEPVTDKARTLLDAQSDHVLSSPIEYSELFSQWGDMDRYPNWKTDNEYWTSDHGVLTARVYELRTGTSRTESINVLNRHYYAYKVGG